MSELEFKLPKEVTNLVKDVKKLSEAFQVIHEVFKNVALNTVKDAYEGYDDRTMNEMCEMIASAILATVTNTLIRTSYWVPLLFDKYADILKIINTVKDEKYKEKLKFKLSLMLSEDMIRYSLGYDIIKATVEKLGKKQANLKSLQQSVM